MKKGKKRSPAGAGILAARASDAFNKGYVLECLLILSNVMEARLKRLISRVEGAGPVTAMNLDQCLKRVKYLHLHGEGGAPLSTHFTIDFFDRLRGWKNQRNAIYKDLTVIHVSVQRIERLAKEGLAIEKELTRQYKAFRKSLKAGAKES